MEWTDNELKAWITATHGEPVYSTAVWTMWEYGEHDESVRIGFDAVAMRSDNRWLISRSTESGWISATKVAALLGATK